MTPYPTDCPCGSRCDGHRRRITDTKLPPNPDETPGSEGIDRYSDRSPREEWTGVWQTKRETHR